jgi:hypothetical protein
MRNKKPSHFSPLISHSPTDVEESELYGYVTNKWSRTAVQPLLIALVVTAFFTACAVALDTLIWNVRFTALAPIFFLASLEGVYTTLWLNQPQRRQLNHLAYRAAEFLVIALLLRLYTWAIAATFPNPANLSDYLKYPYLLVLDGLFLIGLVLTLLAWVRAIAASNDFSELAIDRAEAYYFTLPPSEREAGMKPSLSNRAEIVAVIFRDWLIGGMILLGAAAFVALDPRRFPIQDSLRFVRELALPPAMIIALLVYFVAGLLLLSQARLGALNARWMYEGVIKTPDMERTWHRYVTWLLLALAGIALFLPLGSTLAIGQVLEVMVGSIVTIISSLLYLLMYFLGSLFRPATEQPPPATPIVQPTTAVPTAIPTPLPTSTAPPDDTAQLLISSAFWAVAIVMSIIAITFFLRDRGVRLNWGVLQGVGRGLANWVRALWRDTAEYATDFRHSLRARLQNQSQKETAAAPPPWRFVRLNALSPRDQIRYFYLSTLKRASDQGVPRRQAETPLEFAEDMKSNWPEAEGEIEELTEAFLRARYSPENLAKEDVNPVKKQWKRVKSRLRRRSEK